MALKRISLASAGPNVHAQSGADWDRPAIQSLVRDLQEVAGDLGLKDRHIRVLTALASFVREFTSDNRPVVFASNEALSKRAAGMPVPTLQRTLRQLCGLDLVERNLSPNGKRYPHRGANGAIVEAFGIDLSPLLRQANEIRSLAVHAEERKGRIRLIRDRLSLLRNRLPKEGEAQATIRALLRTRHRCPIELEAAYQNLSDLAEASSSPTVAVLERAEFTPPIHLELDMDALPQKYAAPGHVPSPAIARPANAKELTPNAHQIDTHHQSSKPRIFESEEAQKMGEETCTSSDDCNVQDVTAAELADTCPEAIQYALGKPKSWRDFHNLALSLAPMVGIGEQLARRAHEKLGVQGFTITVLCLVQKFGVIRNPAAYLTRLLMPNGQDYSPGRFLRSIAARQAAAAA